MKHKLFFILYTGLRGAGLVKLFEIVKVCCYNPPLRREKHLAFHCYRRWYEIDQNSFLALA